MPETYGNVNFTSSPGLVATAVQEFLTRSFEDHVINDRVWDRDMQTRPVPMHSGGRVKFNRMSPFAPNLTPLKEGVTPEGQKIFTSAFYAVAKPYGDYVRLTDEWDWNTLDSAKDEVSTRLNEQALDTLDAITCNAHKTGLNVQYAGGKTSRAALTTADTLSLADIKKAVLTLKKNKAKKFDDGFYHAKVGPGTVYDLMEDPLFMDISKYQDKRNIEKGEIGVMYGVKFFETNVPMTFENEAYLYGTVASLTVNGYDEAEKKLTVAVTAVSASSNPEDLAYFCRAMAGKVILVGDDHAVVDYCKRNGANMEIYLRWISSGYSYSSGDTIKPAATNSSLEAVHGTVVYGQNYGGKVPLDYGDNVKLIAKELGSSGTDDPLNQRGSLGWKIKGYTATILEDAFIVRIEHAAS